MTRREVKAPPASALAISPRCVVVDSGPLLALFNSADHWHASVLGWLQANAQITLLTTWPVLTEVCALLARRLGQCGGTGFFTLGATRGLHTGCTRPGGVT